MILYNLYVFRHILRKPCTPRNHPVPSLSAFPPKLRWRHLQEFVEGPVELGKTLEAALKGYIRNRYVRGHQQGLGIAYPGHGDIVRQGKASDPLKLVG